VFRRRSATTTEGPDGGTSSAPGPAGRANGAAEHPGVTVGKGKPTPKRSEAERRRRYSSAPADRKTAGRQSRTRSRAERVRRTEAMRRGEEWALPAKDQGPVKALARNYVDSRRRLSEFYMYGLVVLLFLLFFRNSAVQTFLPPVLFLMIFVMVVEGYLIGRRLKALAAERYPGQSTRGLRMYAAMRALQIRKLRVPKPRSSPAPRSDPASRAGAWPGSLLVAARRQPLGSTAWSTVISAGAA